MRREQAELGRTGRILCGGIRPPGVGLYCGGGRPILFSMRIGVAAVLAIETELVLEDREYRLQRLRVELLRRAGYGLRASLLLAVQPQVDLELAEKLNRLGCPEETALRILL